MDNCPPLFYEEVLERPSGEIDLKVFIDREKLKIHIFAVQKAETTKNYTSKLIDKVRDILPYKKAYIICYLESADELTHIKLTLQKYTDQLKEWA
ncbi:hypothetical protein NEMIN01_1393 [Nematocida minor]|uniref:uncharacterized protein n=1 Tax=Nematocida minor TaxID=1912983 RepID=UPI002220C208|nr:uncharacterized protein NEMIN01_1393 [Nematocida minor]KAI5191185.1 hypothetical protein NEMIN01_1393 [Nematocida minor]